jgi:uncharacterized membrane protein
MELELWFILCLVGYSIGAVSSTLDKYMMNLRYHPVTTVLFRTFFNGLLLGTVGVLLLHIQVTPTLLLLAALPALLLAISFVIYLRVLQRKNASEIQPFSQSLDVLFIFLSSVVFLQESVTWENYLGIVIIVIGTYLVLAENITTVPHLDRWLLIIAALVPLDIGYALLIKTFLGSTEPISLAVSIYLLAFVILTIVLLILRQTRQKTSEYTKPRLRTVFLSSLFAATSAGLLYTALSQANASKVYPMAGISSVAVFLLATVFLQEKFHTHRFIGTIIVVLGIYLISL